MKILTPNTVELRYRDGHRLGQSVHVNKIKPYKERAPVEDPNLPDYDNFNPEKEKTIDSTKLEENEDLPNLEEVDVEDITNHRVKKGKLEYLTTYKDGTTSWQPEENFIGEDGTTTKAVEEYYQKRTDIPNIALWAQIEKFHSGFKSPKVPLNTAVLYLLNILGKRSTYLNNDELKQYLHNKLKAMTGIDEVREFLLEFLADWKIWMEIENNEYEKREEKEIIKEKEEKKIEIEKEKIKEIRKREKEEKLMRKKDKVKKMEEEKAKWRREREMDDKVRKSTRQGRKKTPEVYGILWAKEEKQEESQDKIGCSDEHTQARRHSAILKADGLRYTLPIKRKKKEESIEKENNEKEYKPLSRLSNHEPTIKKDQIKDKHQQQQRVKNNAQKGSNERWKENQYNRWGDEIRDERNATQTQITHTARWKNKKKEERKKQWDEKDQQKEDTNKIQCYMAPKKLTINMEEKGITRWRKVNEKIRNKDEKKEQTKIEGRIKEWMKRKNEEIDNYENKETSRDRNSKRLINKRKRIKRKGRDVNNEDEKEISKDEETKKEEVIGIAKDKDLTKTMENNAATTYVMDKTKGTGKEKVDSNPMEQHTLEERLMEKKRPIYLSYSSSFPLHEIEGTKQQPILIDESHQWSPKPQKIKLSHEAISLASTPSSMPELKNNNETTINNETNTNNEDENDFVDESEIYIHHESHPEEYPISFPHITQDPHPDYLNSTDVPPTSLHHCYDCQRRTIAMEYFLFFGNTICEECANNRIWRDRDYLAGLLFSRMGEQPDSQMTLTICNVFIRAQHTEQLLQQVHEQAPKAFHPVNSTIHRLQNKTNRLKLFTKRASIAPITAIHALDHY